MLSEPLRVRGGGRRGRGVAWFEREAGRRDCGLRRATAEVGRGEEGRECRCVARREVGSRRRRSTWGCAVHEGCRTARHVLPWHACGRDWGAQGRTVARLLGPMPPGCMVLRWGGVSVEACASGRLWVAIHLASGGVRAVRTVFCGHVKGADAYDGSSVMSVVAIRLVGRR